MSLFFGARFRSRQPRRIRTAVGAYFDHPTGQSADGSMAGDDSDGDGLTNLQEFLSGTDPTDASSVFRITNIAILGPDLAITWTTRASSTNQLERATALGTNTNWNAVGAVVSNRFSVPDKKAVIRRPNLRGLS
jgi:hypothetical protein